MSTKQIITKNMSVDAAEGFIESIEYENSYFVFAAKHTPYANNSDQIVLDPDDSVQGSCIQVYNDMLFGKRVTNSEVSQMAKRYDWSSGTVYSMYDDTDATLQTKTFYACVNTGTQTHVYKCLDNNLGSASIVEPSGTDINPFMTPEDGYVWKYMYTANDYMMARFSTNDFIPVVANSTVVANATPGSIEVIAVQDGGIGYNNYLTSAFEAPADIKIGGNPYLYGIGSQGKNLNDYYNGCIIKITSGAAKDEYRIITDYYLSGGQRVIVLNDPFDAVIVPTDTFEINPYVYVFDSGGVKQTNCIARAMVSNTSGNSISKVEILAAGSGYRAANVAVIPHPIVGVTSNASLKAIISPPGGHGSNPNNELGANYAVICTKFIENEFTTLNDFRTVGIIKDPLFANVVVKIVTAETIGSFLIGEKIVQYDPVVLSGTVAINGVSVTGTGTQFQHGLSLGDNVIISNGTANIYANVVSIASNTALTISRESSFTDTGCTITLVRNGYAFSTMSGNSAGQITVTSLNTRGLTDSPHLVGEQSSCTTQIDESLPLEQRVTINGSGTNFFSSFTQLTMFKGTLNTPGFIDDEIVTQDNAITYAQPQARFHSIVDNAGVDNDYMYVTNVFNVFQTEDSPDSDGVIAGSAGRFTVKAKYNGWLVPDSGEILYLENLSPITRANNQSETIKLILEF